MITEIWTELPESAYYDCWFTKTRHLSTSCKLDIHSSLFNLTTIINADSPISVRILDAHTISFQTTTDIIDYRSRANRLLLRTIYGIYGFQLSYTSITYIGSITVKYTNIVMGEDSFCAHDVSGYAMIDYNFNTLHEKCISKGYLRTVGYSGSRTDAELVTVRTVAHSTYMKCTVEWMSGKKFSYKATLGEYSQWFIYHNVWIRMNDNLYYKIE